VQAYHPSDRVPLSGALILLGAAIAGGVIIGLGTYFISREFYLVLMFPMGMGLLGGFVIGAAAYFGKVRSPSAAALFSVLLALILYGTFRYAGYAIGFRKDLRAEIEASVGGAISDEEYAFQERLVLEGETGARGFVGYTKLLAKYGVKLTSVYYTTGSEPPLKGALAYGYWLIEILFAAGIAVAIGIVQPREPFSEEANEWFGAARYVASVPHSASSAVIDALTQGDFTRAGAHLHVEPQPSVPRIEITVRRTHSPTAQVALGVREFGRDRRGNAHTRVFLEGLARPADVEALTGAMQGGAPPQRD
jgi:hypothetical protein